MTDSKTIDYVAGLINDRINVLKTRDLHAFSDTDIANDARINELDRLLDFLQILTLNSIK